jgi:hypothetical protein
MKLIKRNTRKRDKVKKAVKVYGVKKAIEKFVPKRVKIAAAGAVAAVVGVFAVKKAKGSSPEPPAYTPPAPPVAPPTPPTPPPTAPPDTSA